MLCNFNRLPEKEKRLTGISFSLPNVKFQIFFLDNDIFFFTCDGLWTGIPPTDWTTSLSLSINLFVCYNNTKSMQQGKKQSKLYTD